VHASHVRADEKENRVDAKRHKKVSSAGLGTEN
jgi:hypothetical protein